MTTATNSTTQVPVENEGVRLLLIDFVFNSIRALIEQLDAPGTGDFVRDPDADATYWEVSGIIRELERLVAELKDPATRAVTLPYDRTAVIGDLAEEVRWMLSPGAWVGGGPPTTDERRRLRALATDGLALIDAIESGGEG